MAERLDKWLWAARFFKTRSLAAQAVSGGKVEVNGARVKPARRIRAGEQLTIRRGVVQWVVVVRALNRERRPAREAVLLYEETPESREARSSEEERRRQAQARRQRGLGRPHQAGATRAGTLQGRGLKRSGSRSDHAGFRLPLAIPGPAGIPRRLGTVKKIESAPITSFPLAVVERVMQGLRFHAPAPSPSAASERAKQFASFAIRISRPSASRRSRSSRCPLREVELAFSMRPLAGQIAPAVPMPILAHSPMDASTGRTTATIASGVSRQECEGASRRRRSMMRPCASIATASVLVPPRSIPIRIVGGAALSSTPLVGRGRRPLYHAVARTHSPLCFPLPAETAPPRICRPPPCCWLSTALAYTLCTAIAHSALLAPLDALIGGIVDVLLLCGLALSLLVVHRRSARAVQTLTALAGAGTVTTLVAIPFLSWRVSVMRAGDAAGLELAFIAMIVVWNLAVIAHILRHALSTSFLGAVVIAIVHVPRLVPDPGRVARGPHDDLRAAPA